MPPPCGAAGGITNVPYAYKGVGTTEWAKLNDTNAVFRLTILANITYFLILLTSTHFYGAKLAQHPLIRASVNGDVGCSVSWNVDQKDRHIEHMFHRLCCKILVADFLSKYFLECNTTFFAKNQHASDVFT